MDRLKIAVTYRLVLIPTYVIKVTAYIKLIVLKKTAGFKGVFNEHQKSSIFLNRVFKAQFSTQMVIR